MVRPLNLAIGLSCGLLLTAAAEAQKPNPALQPIEDVEGLPRVLLIGDSISMGYTIPVRERLKDKANVHRPKTNCGPTTRGVEQIDDWLGEQKWDVIHVNFGLHDLKGMEDRPHQVSPEDYEQNLRTIFEKLKATGAKIIWCATTPVPDAELSPPRTNADVIAYNAIGAKVAKDFEFEIDDLYSYTLPHLEAWQLPKNVHFKPDGYQKLADQVAKVIADALA